MASSENKDVILLSIMPRYAEAIMDGRKTVEFRRGGIPDSVRFVVVYASSPVQRVVGYFEVDRLDTASPTALWERHGRFGSISRSAFRAYYKGITMGKAIQIRCAFRFQTKVSLSGLGVQPPQSFCYLPPQLWSRMKRWTAVIVPRTT